MGGHVVPHCSAQDVIHSPELVIMTPQRSHGVSFSNVVTPALDDDGLTPHTMGLSMPSSSSALRYDKPICHTLATPSTYDIPRGQDIPVGYGSNSDLQ